jgi:HK97 family phage major capsid protein
MKRSRIEGTLHRSLPATISIRAAEPGQADDGLLRLRLSVSSEIRYLRTSWWDEPWIEVLGHKPGEIDLERLNGGAPVLANHDRTTARGNTPLAGIGAVERAWIEGGRLWADIVISRRDALADLRQDIADGLVKNVSIGYLINERVLVKANPEGQPDEYRVTSWMPFEISPVDVPVDHTVGLGRDLDGNHTRSPNATPGYRVVDLSPAVGTTRERTMDDTTIAPANTNNAGTTQTNEPQHRSLNPAQPRQAEQPNPLQEERARVREITALGRQLGQLEIAERAIDAGTSLDAFRAQVIQAQVDRGQLRAAESPEIGMSRRDVENFSFCRALLAASDPVHAAKLAPFEVECSRAAQDKRGDSRDKTREAAITIPIDVLNRGIALPEGAAAAVARQMIQRAQHGSAAGQEFVRDLLAGTNNAGGHTVATELLGSSFIELLRNALVLDRMGVTMLRDLNGNIAIPSQTAGATGYWVAENGAPTESQQTLGQVTMTPKTVGAFTDYSRRLLLQSSIDVEAFVRADLATVVAQTILTAAINGSGSSNQPYGVLNTSGIGAVAMGTNGAAPTYDSLVDLESAVANVNAAVGNLAFLTNTKVRGKLRKTQVFAGTNGQPVWGKGRESGLGDVMGYDAYVTNAVPSTLTKGSATSVCSAAVFGNWADLLIGMWGGLDVMLDPYTGGAAGTKRVIALQDLDITVRRVASFSAVVDYLTT